MKIHIPWIISRRRLFFALSVEFLITNLIYKESFFREFRSYPNPLVTFSIFFFWIILSYISGRYMICRRINKKEIIKTIFKSLFVFISCNIVYFLINWSNKILIVFLTKSYTLQNEQNIFFIKTTFLITFISCFIQYFLSIFTNKIYGNKKLWLFYGSVKGFKNFKTEIGFKNNFIFERIGDGYDIKKLNLEETEGVILEHNKGINKLNLDHIFYFKSKGIRVLNLLKWFENELQRIPPFFIVTKYQIIEKFNLSDDSYKIRIKRIGDFTISIFLLFITLPLFLLLPL